MSLDAMDFQVKIQDNSNFTSSNFRQKPRRHMKLGRRGGGEKDACLSRRLGRQHDPQYFGHDGILSIKKNVLLVEP